MSFLGFTFNNKHCDAFGIIMKSVDRTILPAKRREGYIIPGRDGSYYDNTEPDYVERQIKVRISFWGEERDLPSLRSRIREIAKWLSADSAPLIFDDEPNKAYTASINAGLSLEQLAATGHCELTFNCQPFAESAYYATETKNMAGNDNLSVQVDGTQDTPCIITIKNVGTTNITGIAIQRKVRES